MLIKRVCQLWLSTFLTESILLAIHGPLLDPVRCLFFPIYSCMSFLLISPSICALTLSLPSLSYTLSTTNPCLLHPSSSLLRMSRLLAIKVYNDCDAISDRLTREVNPLTVYFSSFDSVTVSLSSTHPGESGLSQTPQPISASGTLILEIFADLGRLSYRLEHVYYFKTSRQLLKPKGEQPLAQVSTEDSNVPLH